jgi:hypothetical protein
MSDEQKPSNWAAKVDRLQVERRPEVRGTNVAGRQLSGALQGFGKMWQKTYSVHGLAARPEEVIDQWKAHFAEFWPKGNRFAAGMTGIAPGEIALFDLALGGTRLSTGVLVLYVDDTSFTFMTPQGHMFGGWITFSASEEEGGTAVQAQMLLRASDPIYEVGLALGGHRKEDRFWHATLANLCGHFGMSQPTVKQEVVCVDSKRQWGRWRNIWYNAAVRSAGQSLTGPFHRSPKPAQPASP